MKPFRRERRVIDHIVPAPLPHGADRQAFNAAVSAAERDYRMHHDIPLNEALPGDAIRILPGTNEIVLRIEIEEPNPS